MLKVVKFGGSSLASGTQFEKVKNIVSADEARTVVVVSAPGKRFSQDNKITDLLYICHAHLKYNVSCDDIFDKIRERYIAIKNECGLTTDIESELDDISAKFTKNTPVDFIVSRGEYLCARLMAEYLGYDFIDSAEWLYFDYDGHIDFEKTNSKLSELFTVHKKIVIPGFYGVLPDGQIKVFSRGGSDITGSVAAAALNADCYENWTDVPGILMADPSIVKNPRPIQQITFEELRELSYMGAQVLHEDAVFPIRHKNIPLYIKNTNDINAEGTLIMDSIKGDGDDKHSKFITGISGKKNYTLITIGKANLSENIGYIRHALEIAERFGLAPEHMPSSVDRFSLLFVSEKLTGCLHELMSQLTQELSPDTISVTKDLALVAVVGRRMAYHFGTSGRLFSALGKDGINIRMIEQGADEISIIVGVENAEFEHAIRVLYDSFT
ncbi:MAG: aspartate kinase [Eubacteriales bacterium]|nr:aspartate kinase [Eubacteriales bacterium]